MSNVRFLRTTTGSLISERFIIRMWQGSLEHFDDKDAFTVEYLMNPRHAATATCSGADVRAFLSSKE